MNEPPPVSQFLPGTPPEVDEAFRKGLEKRRESRPDVIEAWASSFADALERTASTREGWPIAAMDASPSRTRDGTLVPVTSIDGDAPTATPSGAVTAPQPVAGDEAPTFEQDAPTVPMRDAETVRSNVADDDRQARRDAGDATRLDPKT